MIAKTFLKMNARQLNPDQILFVKTLIEHNPAGINDFFKIVKNGSSEWLCGVSKIVDFTPDAAREILSHASSWAHPFPEDKAKIDKFSRLIKTGKFQLDLQQPIMITNSNTLVDGRHRLLAVIKAQKSAKMPVIFKIQTLKS